MTTAAVPGSTERIAAVVDRVAAALTDEPRPTGPAVALEGGSGVALLLAELARRDPGRLPAVLGRLAAAKALTGTASFGVHHGLAAVLTAVLSWGGTTVVVHATVHDALVLPALLAEQDNRIVGLLAYAISDDGLEVISLDAVMRRGGVGSALPTAAPEVAKQDGARRMRLVATNDNLDALRFYQRRGLRIVGVAPGAMDSARAMKPSIPLTGEYGIPLHDELTSELLLEPSVAVTATR